MRIAGQSGTLRSENRTIGTDVQDLNDLYFFAEVVAHGGFAPAGRALRLPKSKLSRRIAQLEARLGVRLIERSSRRFRVTDVGQAYYERCRSVMIEAEQAQAVIAETKGEPHGLVRFSCPTGMMEVIEEMVPGFLVRFPRVRVQVIATNRAVDLIEERIDVALRVRSTLDSDATLIIRTLARNERILVASPVLAARIGEGAQIADLASVPTLSSTERSGEDTWEFIGPTGETTAVRHEPRMVCGEFPILRRAAVEGLGVALLPDHLCRHELRDGRLRRVFPAWHAAAGTVHLVFTTQRGLPPAVRAFIDHLARRFREEERAAAMP